MLKSPVLLVHGGAWNIPDEMVEAHRAGIHAALDAGWAALQRGGSALDAVEAAVVVMEDDVTFDAGRGSFLTADGRVQLDAMIMDGGTLRAGGVGCVERVRNAVRAARRVLEDSPHVYLVGEGAERFAAAHGVALCDNKDLVIDREIERLRSVQTQGTVGRPVEFFAEHDTVGAVALDARGDLAAATSTGGTINKTPGRVGDSSLIGCGCYADNQSAAVSTTGWGEPMMKLVLAKWAADRVADGGSPTEVAWRAMDYLKQRLGGHGGLILLGPDGRFGIAHNTPRMAWACRTARQSDTGLECRRPG